MSIDAYTDRQPLLGASLSVGIVLSLAVTGPWSMLAGFQPGQRESVLYHELLSLRENARLLAAGDSVSASFTLSWRRLDIDIRPLKHEPNPRWK